MVDDRSKAGVECIADRVRRTRAGYLRRETLPGERMICRQSISGVGCSVVELNGVRHVFASAIPRREGSFEEQVDEALRMIQSVTESEGAPRSVVTQTVFLADEQLLGPCRQMLRDFYGEHLPVVTYVPQHPCEGTLVAMEAMCVGGGPGEVEIQRHGEQVVITRHSGITWTHVGQILPRTLEQGVYARSIDGFNQMRQMLAQVNVRFDQIIRTWLYLGDIVGPEGNTQRYMEMNRARSDYYENVRFLAQHVPSGVTERVYPASTGIGTDSRDVLMSCLALSTKREDIVACPLENPLQTSAFDYMACYGPKSPKFSRAMALTTGGCTTLLISGTASIIQSESQHIEDIEGQTHQTLDNIAALISDSNLARHGLPGRGATLRELASARVYIKRQADFEKTRKVCEERLGDLPIIYTVADVCRPELLVEIEGIAFAQS